MSNKLYVVKEEGNDSSDSDSPLKNKYTGILDNKKINKKLPNMKRLQSAEAFNENRLTERPLKVKRRTVSYSAPGPREGGD